MTAQGGVLSSAVFTLIIKQASPGVTIDGLVQAGILLVAIVAAIFGTHQWIRGGSVLRVKFELGRTDGSQTVRSIPSDFDDPETLKISEAPKQTRAFRVHKGNP